MFSSVGQIVGLIEIEPAASDSPYSSISEVECEFRPDAEDASLDDLLARLAGRSATGSSQTCRTKPSAAQPANRLALPDPWQTSESVLGADLARLETELAAETLRLRLLLAEAGSRGWVR